MNDSCFNSIQGIDVIPIMTRYLEQLLENPSLYFIDTLKPSIFNSQTSSTGSINSFCMFI